MNSIILKNQDILSTNDDFIKQDGCVAGSEFSQSVKWLEILLAEKAELSLCKVLESDEVLLQGAVTKKSFLFNKLNYQYCSRGPIVKLGLDAQKTQEAFSLMIDELRKSSDPVFFRCEPSVSLFDTLRAEDFKFKKSIDLQPQKTLILDLKLSEEALLKAMHHKTRYNIRLAKRKGVEVCLAASFLENEAAALMDFESFWSILKKTSDRDSFNIHSRSHYLHLLSHNNLNRLYLAKYEGRVIAAGIFSFFDNKVTYLHGASDNELRSLMAPYLLQFTVIQKAQEEGYSYYDFYGIDEIKWPGVTRFKMGFGGFVHEYAGTYDLILRPFHYYIYNLLRRLRRLF